MDDVLRAYALERDLLKIAQRVILSGNIQSFIGTSFIGRPATDVKDDVARLRGRLDEITIVALWAVFERFILDRTRAQLSALSGSQLAALGEALREFVGDKIEYARFDEVLDIYKAVIAPQTIGQAKQVKDYRDWIAHRNPSRAVPSIDPKRARLLLGSIMDQIP